MKTPWDIAAEIPSAHGLPLDTMAHLTSPGVVISTPEYFLLAHEVALPEWYRRDPHSFAAQNYNERLQNPFARFTDEGCNAWAIGVLAGDMVAACQALIAVAGEREYLCWQDRRNGYRWRKTGPAFNRFLENVHHRQIQKAARERELSVVHANAGEDSPAIPGG